MSMATSYPFHPLVARMIARMCVPHQMEEICCELIHSRCPVFFCLYLSPERRSSLEQQRKVAVTFGSSLICEIRQYGFITFIKKKCKPELFRLIWYLPRFQGLYFPPHLLLVPAIHNWSLHLHSPQRCWGISQPGVLGICFSWYTFTGSDTSNNSKTK